MKKMLLNEIIIDDHSGCFGNFSADDLVCRKMCALCIRCAIERDQTNRLEMLDDMVSMEGVYMRIH